MLIVQNKMLDHTITSMSIHCRNYTFSESDGFVGYQKDTTASIILNVTQQRKGVHCEDKGVSV